ncbi:MATE family efflux transporter [Winogradskyella ludwigii]|uniref:polysaccharide biosynthesis protein n=1 Tax=Winogradskyella ludwigii TaxID=2686076 RepID=UPI0015C7CF73|nr:polysaccharide biosynthesis protein [Winogradskyella ludwigii]
MKFLLNSSVKHWLKLLTITGSAQILVQVLGFVGGILVIRLLPVEEYAWYVLANTMLGAMTVLADGGISQGVMSEGGKVWQDKVKLGKVLATGLDLRRKFAIFSLILMVPILLYFLIKNNASWITSIFIALSLIPAFYASLSDTLLQIVPKLHQNIGALQKNQVKVSLGRLVLLFATLFIFPLAYVVILANGIPRIYGNIKLYEIAGSNVEIGQKPDLVIRGRIVNMVKRILPGAIYYAFSGQLIIWLASIFSNTTSIAYLGALGRINMLLSLFTVIINMLIIPRFARLESIKILLLKRLIQILGVTITAMLGFLLIVYMFRSQILWVLGESYKDLEFELVLIIISGVLNLLAGVCFSLYASRGWVLKPMVTISVNVGVTVLGVFMLDISTLSGLLYLNITIGLIAFLTNGAYIFFKIIKLKSYQRTDE